MIAVAVGIVLLLVVGGMAWARFSAARAERVSVDTYERTLDLLGDVAKRSDASADIHVPTPTELARPHVRPAIEHDFPGPSASAVRIVPPARVRLEPPVLPGQPASRLPVFGDADLVGSDAVDAVDAGKAELVARARAASLPAAAAPAGPAVPVGPAVPAGPATPPIEPLTEVMSVIGAGAGGEAPAGEVTTPESPTTAQPSTDVLEPAIVSDVSPAGASDASELASELEPAVVFDFDDVDEPVAVPRKRLRGLPGGGAHVGRPPHGPRLPLRRAATGAAAAVAVGAIAVGSWQLASHDGSGSPPAGTPSTTPTNVTTPPSHSGSGHTKSPPQTTTPTTAPTTLEPTSKSPTLVTYTAPSGAYTVTMKATTSDCWLGAQTAVNTTAYLRMWTLQPGESASYRASGPLVIKIGVPQYIQIKVDGTPVTLPSSYTAAYDISFTSSAPTTSA